jgi:hypothetical protein
MFLMSFLGLISVEAPFCVHCETPIPAASLPEEEFEPKFYRCIKCGTEMSVEHEGDGIYSVYPDEDSMPD